MSASRLIETETYPYRYDSTSFSTAKINDKDALVNGQLLGVVTIITDHLAKKSNRAGGAGQTCLPAMLPPLTSVYRQKAAAGALCGSYPW